MIFCCFYDSSGTEVIAEKAVQWLEGREFLPDLVPKIALYIHVYLSVKYSGSIRVPFAAAQCLIFHLIALRISI